MSDASHLRLERVATFLSRLGKVISKSNDPLRVIKGIAYKTGIANNFTRKFFTYKCPSVLKDKPISLRTGLNQ